MTKLRIHQQDCEQPHLPSRGCPYTPRLSLALTPADKENHDSGDAKNRAHIGKSTLNYKDVK